VVLFSSGLTPVTCSSVTGSRSNSTGEKFGSLCSGRKRVSRDVCVAYEANRPVNIKKEKKYVR